MTKFEKKSFNMVAHAHVVIITCQNGNFRNPLAQLYQED